MVFKIVKLANSKHSPLTNKQKHPLMQGPDNRLALKLIEKARHEGAKKLDLGNCGLTELPEELAELTELEELVLSDSSFDFDNMQFRKSINSEMEMARGNDIHDFSLLQRLGKLRKLNLRVSPSQDLSPLETLHSLREVQLYGNVDNLSPISKLPNLASLLLFGNEVSDISPLKNLKNLKTLALTVVENLSPLTYLPNLETLFLGEITNDDIELLSQLKKIKTLVLVDNEITDLSPLNKLKNIQTLGLSGRGIKDISMLEPLIRKGLPVKVSTIGEAGNFAEAGIILGPSTPLQVPPLEVAEQGNAAILEYFDSMKKEEEASTGTRKIDDKEPTNLQPDDGQVTPSDPSAHTYTNEVKLIVVGNSTCGKTTLVKYLLNNRSISEKHSSTHGMEQHIWNYKRKIDGLDRELKIRIYDFGGQEYYHDTHHLFFSQNAIFLLVWEQASDQYGKLPTKIRINGKETEMDLEHFGKTYWLSAIHHFTGSDPELWQHILDMAERSNQSDDFMRNIASQVKQAPSKYAQGPILKGISNKKASKRKLEVINKTPDEAPKNRERKLNTPILVIQNKIDLHGIQAIDQATLNEIFPNVYDYCAISLYRKAPRRLSILKEVFHEMLSNTEIVGRVMPNSWEAVKNKLEQNSESNPLTMSYEEFTEFCMAQSPLMEESYVEVIAKWLHHIGTLLYFHDNDDLKLTVFTNPKKLTENIYKILNDEVAKRGGVFKKADINKALKLKKFDKTCETLLDLMLHNKIVFEQSAGTYVAPQYLPELPDTQVQIFISAYTQTLYRYNFRGFLHRNVLLEAFAQYGKLAKVDDQAKSTHHHYWRNGIVLAKDNNYLLIEFDREQAYINLKVQPASNTDNPLIKEVLTAFENITEGTLARLEVSVDNQNFVPLKKLEEAAQSDGKEMMVRWKGQIFHLSKFSRYIKHIKKFKLLRVFISYASQDEPYRGQLEKHLSVMQRMGFIDAWHDRKLLPGEEISSVKNEQLQQADLILLLVSSDFLASNYIWDEELKVAMKMEEQGLATVIPIILRPCMWEITSFNKLKNLPSPDDGKAISQYANNDEAWKLVMKGIRERFEN